MANRTPIGYDLTTGNLGPLSAADTLTDADGTAVAPSGGDYTLLSAAITAGKKAIFVRNGTYVETTTMLCNYGTVRIVAESHNAKIQFTTSGGEIQFTSNASGALTNVGTVSITSGTTIVTGVSTAWSTAGIVAGDYIYITSPLASYLIKSVDSDTQLTLVQKYYGPTVSGSTHITGQHVLGHSIEGLSFERLSGSNEMVNVLSLLCISSLVRDCIMDAHTNTSVGSIRNKGQMSLIEGNTIIGSSPNTSGAINSDGRDVRIINNKIFSGDGPGIYMQGVRGTAIGNYVDGARYGIRAIGDDMIIVGNTFLNIGTSNAIHASATTRAIVANNICSGQGINIFTSGDKVVVSGNQVTGSAGIGIQVTANGTNDICSVTSNIVMDSVSHGIQVGGTGIAQFSVMGNISKDNGGDGIVNTTDRAVINSNISQGNTGNGMDVSNTDECVVTGNQIYGNTAGQLITTSATNLITANNNQ